MPFNIHTEHSRPGFCKTFVTNFSKLRNYNKFVLLNIFFVFVYLLNQFSKETYCCNVPSILPVKSTICSKNSQILKP